MSIPKLKNKKNGCRGYIFSREINGNFIPQRVQNLVIKDFAERKNIFYKLSQTEYIMKNSYLMLHALLGDLKSIDGIIFYSLEMLPEKSSIRNDILKKLILNKKIIYFALEEIELRNIKKLNEVEKLINIKKIAMKKNSIKKIYSKI